MASYQTYPANKAGLFSDKQFILALINAVKSKVGRQLFRTEKMHMLNMLKNIDPVKFKGNNKTILEALSTLISEQIVRTPCGESDDVNIHEMLKAQIGVTTEDNNSTDIKSDTDFSNQIISTFTNQVEVVSLFGNKTASEFLKIINPTLVKRTISIVLDTRYRILDNDGTTYFRWNFINNETTAQGTVNAIGNIRDITAIRIFPVRIPWVATAENDYDRVTIFIQEFSAQSFIGQENRRFHFMFDTLSTDRWIDLKTENFNDGYFRFRNPITRLETLTLSFGSPLEQIVFDTDRMSASVTTYGTKTEFTTTSAHNLEAGDRVYISSFSTANINTDTVIVTAINKSAGHIINSVTDYVFKIDVDSTNIRVIGVGTVAVVNGGTTITGTGTSFGTFFAAGDAIEINSVKYTIQSIETQTSLTISASYAGITASGLTFYRNNTLSALRPTLYFGSKRVFIAMEIEFYDTE